MLIVVVLYLPVHHGASALLAIGPLMLFQITLVSVMGYALAILAAALRDTVQLVGFMLSVGIYLSPALFPLSMFPEGWRWILWANPMTASIVGYQDVLLLGHWPELTVWLANGLWLAVSLIFLAVLVERSRDQLLDWL